MQKPVLVNQERNVVGGLVRIDNYWSNGDHTVSYGYHERDTINEDGKAYNGNRGALIVAGLAVAAFVAVGLINWIAG